MNQRRHKTKYDVVAFFGGKEKPTSHLSLCLVSIFALSPSLPNKRVHLCYLTFCHDTLCIFFSFSFCSTYILLTYTRLLRTHSLSILTQLNYKQAWLCLVLSADVLMSHQHRRRHHQQDHSIRFFYFLRGLLFFFRFCVLFTSIQ